MFMGAFALLRRYAKAGGELLPAERRLDAACAPSEASPPGGELESSLRTSQEREHQSLRPNCCSRRWGGVRLHPAPEFDKKMHLHTQLSDERRTHVFRCCWESCSVLQRSPRRISGRFAAMLLVFPDTNHTYNVSKTKQVGL